MSMLAKICKLANKTTAPVYTAHLFRMQLHNATINKNSGN